MPASWRICTRGGRPTRARSIPPGAPSSPPSRRMRDLRGGEPRRRRGPRRPSRPTARLALGDRRPVAGAGRQAGKRDRPGVAGGERGRGARPHPRFPARHHDDPRLSDARAPEGQPRSPGPGDHAGRRHRAGPGHLRLLRGRLRPADLPRLCAGAGDRHHARNPRDPAAHLLRQCRRAVHAHLRSRGEGLAAAAHRGPRQGDHLHPGGQDRHPEEADRGRGLRALPGQALPRHQALRPGRRRGGWSRRWSRSSSAAARWG